MKIFWNLNKISFNSSEFSFQVQQELSSLLKEVPIISWNFIIINNVNYIKLFVDTIITNNLLYNKNPEFRVLSPTKNRNKNLKMLPQFQNWKKWSRERIKQRTPWGTWESGSCVSTFVSESLVSLTPFFPPKDLRYSITLPQLYVCLISFKVF